jgi:hypothetical protein
MTDRIDNPGQTRKRSTALLIATSVFGLLYLWFIVVSFIPAPQGNWISTTVPFEPFDVEQISVKLLFLLFLIGYLLVWRNVLIGGTVFLVWWVAMWCHEIFVSAPIKGADAGAVSPWDSLCSFSVYCSSGAVTGGGTAIPFLPCPNRRMKRVGLVVAVDLRQGSDGN